jgi:hypothetical protein
MKRLLSGLLNKIRKEWFLLVMLGTIILILYVASLF